MKKTFILKSSDNILTLKAVGDIKVTRFYRIENRSSTMSGGIAIDRGLPKLKITVLIKMLSTAEMTKLENLVAKAILSAQFFYLGEEKEITVIAEPISSRKTGYVYGDEKTPVYTDIVLELEEQ